jgi:hypothetical protein
MAYYKKTFTDATGEFTMLTRTLLINLSTALYVVALAHAPQAASSVAPQPLSFRLLPVGEFTAGSTTIRLQVQIRNVSTRNVFFGFASAGCAGHGLVSSIGHVYVDSKPGAELVEASARAYATSVVDGDGGGCPELAYRYMLGPGQKFTQLIEIANFVSKGRPNLSRAGVVKLRLGLRVMMLDDAFECSADYPRLDDVSELVLRVR